MGLKPNDLLIFAPKKREDSLTHEIPGAHQSRIEEQNGRRARKFGVDRSLLKPPDNGLGHARDAHLLAAGRRCCAPSCARPIIVCSEKLQSLRASGTNTNTRIPTCR